ncbi:MAG TPA: hypothetical protein VFK24_02040 [Gammaproteobacteria bacterium]|nr:hypothetical protein [Gammaproteobacteria bacterium]
MTRTRLKFEFLRNEHLPRLAWCARISRDSDAVQIEHGDWVETRDNFFVEGAWDGAFDGGALDEARVLLGSGGQLLDDAVVFYATTHTMERLQSVRVGDDLFISNSFAYLLTATGDSPDVNYRFYERDFITFLKGRRAAARAVPTMLKRHVHLYYGEKIVVGPDLEVGVTAYSPGPSVSSYGEYVEIVNGLLARLNDNANAASRSVRYAPISTLSTGYDSPACTVFAKKIGCRTAITFLEARDEYNGRRRGSLADSSDSGMEIGKYLDVELFAFGRSEYLRRYDYPEAEFLATGNGGDDVVICAAQDYLPGRMLFTGYLGDTLWGADTDPSGSCDYKFSYPAGGTFNEFRLRVGFIHVPVPLLTFPNHSDILRISRSSEMAPWRLGGNYDRPIPRRLVESSGVPRSIYAREKKAVSQPFWLPSEGQRIRAMMSPHSWESLLSYFTSPEVKSRLSLASRLKMLLLPTAPIPAFLNRCTWKVKRVLGTRLLPELQEGQFRTSILYSTPVGLKFHWAIQRTAVRYSTTCHNLRKA